MEKNIPRLSIYGDTTTLYLPSGKQYSYFGINSEDSLLKNIENNQVIKSYKKIFEKLNHEDKQKYMIKEFGRWEQSPPSNSCVAFWLIETYEAEMTISSLNEMEYSGKNLEEEIAWLKEELAEKQRIINEKDAIINQKTLEHDEYIKNNGNDDGEKSGTYRYVLQKGDSINLSLRERNIIEYVIHCVALKPKEGLSANIKRLIGKEKTVSGHYNDSKLDSSRPLSAEEKKNIKRVLEAENIDYKKWLKEHI